MLPRHLFILFVFIMISFVQHKDHLNKEIQGIHPGDRVKRCGIFEILPGMTTTFSIHGQIVLIQVMITS